MPQTVVCHTRPIFWHGCAVQAMLALFLVLLHELFKAREVKRLTEHLVGTLGLEESHIVRQ